ncbi:uncharacterized protein LOC131147583 [Malania oleifera]|uniref:uncharacterized protein LOC131147583 n=1 Tax=Malania oleifera TaxID=397392 RepID=UPI0025ADDF71|nr:uncharacterized protein LOC131147583 [Malania oleifera]
MKKLSRQGKVHPSKPATADLLALLPATILSLTAVLSPEDKAVLAYLISCYNSSANFSRPRKNTQKMSKSTASGGGEGEHPPSFHCDCFSCYMSYWARWDSSPNRQLIHEIIEAYEDGLSQKKTTSSTATPNMNKKERRRARGMPRGEESSGENPRRRIELGGSESAEVTRSCTDQGKVGEGDDDGSVRKIVNFIGEKLWGTVWGK